MTHLTLHRLEPHETLAMPEHHGEFDRHTRALAVLPDFARHPPQVLNGDLRATDAFELLRRGHARVRMVVDPAGEFEGLVTLDCLGEDSLLKRVARGEHRAEICVRDVMIRRPDLPALAWSDLESGATLGDLADTLEQYDEAFCLVYDGGRIRSLIAAEELAEHLGMRLNVGVRPSFARIFDAVHR